MTAKYQGPALVIFDCDGVLVDSERIAKRVLHELLVGWGATLSENEAQQRFLGASRSDVVAFMAEQRMPLPDRWFETYYQRSFEVLEQELRPIPGAPIVVRALKRLGVAYCVASNGTVDKMRVTLTKCGMIELFQDRMYSAYDIGQSKPAPDVFLHAARVHGVAPSRCAVIEDSPAGISAARAAGMRCLAYAPGGAETLGDPDGVEVFHSMTDLPGLLGVPVHFDGEKGGAE